VSKKSFISVCLTGAFLCAPATYAGSLDVCKSTSDSIRKLLPARKDSMTVVKNVICAPGNPKNKFIYILEVSGIPLDVLNQMNMVRDIKPDGLNQFCTDPSMRSLLNAFDVDHRYYTDRGVFVGSFLMESGECKGK
jgi:hypothetical protein